VTTNNAQYIYKRGNVYYYSRRIPSDLSTHYKTTRIIKSLRTRSKRSALLSSSHLSLELDSYWSSIRIKDIAKLYTKQSNNGQPTGNTGFTLSDALEHYIKIKGSNKSKLFHQATNRSVRYALECLGERDLSEYSTADAGKLRDSLFKRGMVSSSVRRVFSSVKSIVNLAIKEQGLGISNPFSDVYMPDLDDTKQRKPIPIDIIKAIQNNCRTINDDMRWAIALISDTGMRLAEVIGLKRDDIVLNDTIPHVIIRNNPKRRLKTKQSERTIPLIGNSLWAAKRALDNTQSEYIFERYNKGAISNANSASAAFNKWIKYTSGKSIVIHSFRHSMRDRLRAVECPSDIIDSIGGWSKKSVGETYGSGYPLKVLDKWMKKII